MPGTLWRWIRLLAFLLLFLLVVYPVRDIVLFPFIPTAWISHHSLRIMSMLLETQHFSNSLLFREYSAGNPSLMVNLSDIELFMRGEPYPEYQHERQHLVNLSKSGVNVAKELDILEHFQPSMNIVERAQLLFTLDVFHKACLKYNIDFFIIEGSLLGAWRHHGLVPWDDDVDVAMNSSQWQKALMVLGNIPGFTLYAPYNNQWKFYLSSLPDFHDKPFKWPNIDLFFFVQHESYIWALTWGMKHHLLLETKELLPLTSVRFEQFKLPAPACTERLLRSAYGTSETCVTPMYVHKTNKEQYSLQTRSVNCAVLHKYYPFVFRLSKHDHLYEVLKVGKKILWNTMAPLTSDICNT